MVSRLSAKANRDVANAVDIYSPIVISTLKLHKGLSVAKKKLLQVFFLAPQPLFTIDIYYKYPPESGHSVMAIVSFLWWFKREDSCFLGLYFFF